MNLILLTEADFCGDGRAVLRGHRHRHVRRILHAKEGDTLCVGLLGGRIGSGRIASLCEQELTLHIEWTSDPPPPLACTLVLALPRPPVLGRVLSATTSFGVKRIVLLHARRVEKTYWKARALQPETIREKLLLGLAQARDTVLPEVEIQPRFRPFVEDVLPAMIGSAAGYLADGEAAETCPPVLSTPCVLAVGPEGGFVDFEVEQLRRAGLRAVHLGRRALRVETAVPAFLSRAVPA